MSVYIIERGYPLDGSVRIHGAKNSILSILAACLLALGECIIHNCPGLSDVAAFLDILRHLGCRTERRGDTVVMDTPAPTGWNVPDVLTQGIRSSVTFLGAILGCMGRVELYVLDGCGLGPRPIDLHPGAIRGLGDRITEGGDGLWAEGVLRGVDLVLSLPNVGTAESTMLVAVCATGITIITNAAQGPEITDLQGFLWAIGAKVCRAGSSAITVEGGIPLHGGGYTAVGDRAVAVTRLTVTASVSGTVEVTGVDYRHLFTVSAVLQGTRRDVQSGAGSIRLHRSSPLQRAWPVYVIPYPDSLTDARAPLMAALAWRESCTAFVENISESRYRHVGELSRMGADTRMGGRMAVVYGVPRSHGAQVQATDLRGGATLTVAALGAERRDELTGAYHIDQGYQSLERDLRRLGIEIQWI